MTKNKSKLLFYTIGTIAPGFMSLATIPLFSFMLSKEELGFYDLLISSINLFAPIISLQLGYACYCSAREEPELSKKANIIKTILIFSSIFHVILFIVSWLVSPYFDLIYTTHFLFITISASFFSVLGLIARALEKQKVFVFSSIANAFGIFIFSALLFYFGKKGIEPIIYAYICTNCLTIGFLIFSLKLPKIIFQGHYNSRILQESLHFSLPLIPNALSWWFVNLANRYIITYYLGVGANGVFAVATKIPSILNVCSSVFTLMLQDISFTDQKNKKDDAYYDLLFKKLFIIQLASCLVIVAFGKPLTSLFFSPIYAETYRLIPLILAGSLFANFASFWGIFYQLEKKTTTILKTNVYGAIFNCVITLLFIKYIGLYAPALGTMTGFLSMWLMRMKSKIVHRKFDLPIGLITQLLLVFFVFSLLILSGNLYINYLLMIASIVILVYSISSITPNWKRYFKRKHSTLN
nr:oligosaccharide flippase family protein [uncultured Emticicia sp.]